MPPTIDKGGADSYGLEMAITFNLGLPSNPQVGPGVAPMFPNPGPWGAGNVPTIGLPLLWEIRCYPDDGALGLNQFDLGTVVLNGAPSMRAFSNGGVATGGITVIKDPDLQTTATGGFNPTSTPPGFVTVGLDNGFYLGQLNLVSRISRAHTIWFDTPTVNVPRYVEPLVHPAPERQPAIVEHARPILTALDHVIREGQEKGIFQPLDPIHLASTIAGATVFFVAATPLLGSDWPHDPLSREQLSAHRAEILRIARRLLGTPRPRPVSGRRGPRAGRRT